MLSNEQLQRKLSGVLISFHTNNYGGAAARTIPSSCPILYGEYQALGSITLCPAPSYPAPPLHSSRLPQRDAPAKLVTHAKLGGQVVATSSFSVLLRWGKGQALSRAMRCSFFKRHDEYTDRINVYTHHDRSENKR